MTHLQVPCPPHMEPLILSHVPKAPERHPTTLPPLSTPRACTVPTHICIVEHHKRDQKGMCCYLEPHVCEGEGSLDDMVLRRQALAVLVGRTIHHLIHQTYTHHTHLQVDSRQRTLKHNLGGFLIGIVLLTCGHGFLRGDRLAGHDHANRTLYTHQPAQPPHHHPQVQRRLLADIQYDSGRLWGVSKHPRSEGTSKLLKRAESPPSSHRESRRMQVHRLVLRDDTVRPSLPGQSLCPATPRKDTKLHLGQCQLGQRVGQAVVAAQRKLQLQTRTR